MRVLDPWLGSPPDPPADQPPTDGPAVAARYADLTVDEMVEGFTEQAELGPLLDAVRHTVREDGVSVTVDLHGKLVDLELDPRAMRGRAVDLAATVRRLAGRATAAAHAEALALLAARLPAGPLLALLPAPASRPAADPAPAPVRRPAAGPAPAPVR